MTELTKKKILVVDDEPAVCKSIREALLREDYEIDTAPGGEEALRLAGNKTYDVFLVDLMMPDIGGLDLLKIIRAECPAARVIMITGYPTVKNTLQAMQTGAFDFLPKPFLPSTLRSLVAKALGGGEGETGSSASG
jgi:DNA-binding NtrC family response regulator